MFHFLRKLFDAGQAPAFDDSDPLDHQRHEPEVVDHRAMKAVEKLNERYFSTMRMFQEEISNRDYERAAQFVRENLCEIPEFPSNTKLYYDYYKLERKFTEDIQSIPALEKGGTILALVGDEEKLKEMREIVRSVPELAGWISVVDQHEDDMRLFAAILRAVEKNPDCQQKKVKHLVGTEDGKRVAKLISWLEKAKKLNRTKSGSSYVLSVTGSGYDQAPTPKKQVKSHRADRKPLRCREIDFNSLPYVPLPRAPERWEKADVQHPPQPVEEASEWFEIRDADGWKLLSVEKIPLGERPDPAFRQIHPIDTGLIMVDDLGKSGNCGSAPAAALRFGREGNRVVEAPLKNGIYRIGVNALGQGLIAMSKDSVAHAYDDTLNCILETSLLDSPEVRALQQRFPIIAADKAKNYLRCIAIAHDNSRYLATGVDEAWCIDIMGHALWSVQLPPWQRDVEKGSKKLKFGTAVDVMHALDAMDLTLPFTPEDLKQRYRNLAKQWHPDLNPGNPIAEERMKAITAAVEILTGLEPETKAMSVDNLVQKTVESSISYLQLPEVNRSDWIYAANFAGHTHDVFLAGYSGMIIQVNGEGQPMRTYDIGAVPRRIVDTGDYLYFLADTRLYTLRDDSLVALIDTLESKDLIVAQTGFGLLEEKRFRWFDQNGTSLGAVVTKNPIRRVYYTPKGMVVETRQRRAIIEGVPTWWD